MINNSEEYYNINEGFGRLPKSEFEAEYLRLIESDLAEAQARLEELPESQRRGISIDTYRHFKSGYSPTWILTKSRAEYTCGLYTDQFTGEIKRLPPPSPRIIIPTISGRHFNAVATSAARQSMEKRFWKQHAGSMELFYDPAVDLAALNTDLIVIFEGELNVMSIWQASAGTIAAVAILGCDNWKKTLLPKLSELQGKKFLLLLDSDARKSAKNLRDELVQRGYPAVTKFYFEALSADDKNYFGMAVDPNDILKHRGNEFLNTLTQKIIATAIPEFTNIEEEINQRNIFLQEQSAQPTSAVTFQSPPMAKQSAETNEPSADEARKIISAALKFIPAKKLSRNEWFEVGTILYRYGFTLEDFNRWSNDGDGRYSAEDCRTQWNSFKTAKELNGKGNKIGTLIHIAKKFGYQPAPMNNDSSVDYEKLFSGLKPIQISAGAILNVVDADDKPAFETLFVEKNFPLFIAQTAAPPTEDTLDTPAMIYSTPFGDNTISAEQIKRSLTWLIEKLYPFFYPNTDRIKSFIIERLQAAGAVGAIPILQDDNFFAPVQRAAKSNFAGKPFRFDTKFRRELIAFAKHSPEIFQSLLRFDYRRVEFFLQNTFTDLACAELLVAIQKNFLRFDETQGTWYTWSKNHWHAVKIKSKSPLYDLWSPLARKARVFAEFERFKKKCELDDFYIDNPKCIQKGTPESEKYQRLAIVAKNANAKFKETLSLENSRNMDNFLEQASGLPEIQIQTKDLDQNKYLFNCANCTINLKTMETYPARQEDLITLVTTTIFDPAATSETWNNFLQSAIPDDELRNWLQMFCGYCLCGDTSEDLFAFIHGPGGSGKTTYVNAIKRAIGDYAKIFSVDMITENNKQKDGNEPDPALAALRTCRLALSSETKKNRRLDEAKIKLLSGGNPLSARELHKPPFEFFPHFKIIIDGNFTLSINDINDLGIRRRLRIIPFNHPPTADKLDTLLDEKLSTPQSRSAILNWLIEGWQKYQRLGAGSLRKNVPAAMKTALNDYYSANDALADFLEAHYFAIGAKTDSHYQIPVMAVWKSYNSWQRQTPRAPIFTRADFISALLRKLENDVELKTIEHKDFFVGLSIDTNPVTPPLEYQ